jgi:hypothetical protein
MDARNFLRLCFLLGLDCFLPVTVQAEEVDEKEKIEALIRHVENLKGASFIRNGKSADAKSAAKFLRGKWNAKEKEIKTADEFIAKVATVSSTTGKPYLIKFSDGREVKCGEYLTGELKK